MKVKWLVTILFASVLSLGWSSAWANDGSVHITPLGSNGGNSCGNDRAIILEDPNGTRILYDPGRTVAGGADPRLGVINGMILSSVHSDHIGVGGLGVTLNGVSECNGAAVAAEVNSNFIAILAFKQDEQASNCPGPMCESGGPLVRVGGEVRDFLRAKLADECFGADGVNDNGGNDDDFACFPGDIDTLRHGGSANIGGVKVAVIAAHHSNGIPLNIVDPLLSAVLAPDDLVPYVGPENGYVLYFTNTLAVYLSGDTGHTSDMKHIVRDFYDAKVAILNCGDKFSMGPRGVCLRG